MRPRLILALPLVLLGGCATMYAIVPQGSGVVKRGGLRLVAEGDAWNGNPYDLPNYATPILVDIENHTDKDIRIGYADFSLVNDQGFRYAAINPYTTATAVGINEAAPVADNGAPVVLAAYGGSAHHRRRASPPPRWRYHRRFFVRPRVHVYFHTYDPWLYPFLDPPFYGDHVVVWSDTRSPPSEDVLRLGLPEGVVKPGGRISGFIYFQNAGQRSNHLRLSWTAHTPQGKKLATLDLPFNVVPR
jgi:uncharacterized protein YceK